MTNDEKKKKKTNMIVHRDLPFFSPREMWHEMDNVFNAFRRQLDEHLWHPFRPFLVPHAMESRARLPPMDFKDKGDSFILSAELPGVSKEDIDITITDSRIVIKTETKEEKMEETECFVCQERSSTNFQRTFDFPDDVVADDAKATLQNGILEIVLPKRVPEPKKEAKKLEIK